MQAVKKILYILTIFVFVQTSTAQKLDSLLHEIKKSADDTSKVKLYLQITKEIYITKTDFQSTKSYADSAFYLSQKINWDKGEMLVWLRYAGLHEKTNNSDKEIEAYLQALQLSKNILDHKSRAYILSQLGLAYRRKDNYAESIKYYLRAIQLADSNQNDITRLYCLNGLGNNYILLGNIDKAEKYFNEALKLAKRLNNKLSMAININNLGEALTERGKFEEAEIMFSKSLKLNLDLENQKGVSICNASLGRMFFKQEKYYQALHFFKKSLNIEKTANDDYYLSIAYINLGKTYIKLGNIKQGENLLKEGLRISNQISSKGNRIEAYKIFEELYLSQKNYEKAYKYQKLYINLKDSLTNQEIQTKTMALQLDYDLKSSNQELSMLKAEKEFARAQIIKNIIIAVVGIFSIFVVIITYFLLKQNNIRKKANKDLQNHLREKEILIAEIHHRVKNNLAIISGLIELQIQNFSPKNALNALKDTQIRIHTFALVHEEVYYYEEQSEINFGRFLKELTKNFYFKENNNNIELKISTQEIKVNLNIAVSLGLIVNEILSNIFRHAFPDNREGMVNIEYFENEGTHNLKIEDNGIGLKEIPNMDSPSTAGFMIISIYLKQLRAKLDITNHSGTSYHISFKPSDMKTWT